jgi:hypothetical protein
MEVEEKGIPKLILPPPIPVRPPKFQYSQYENEYKQWNRGESAWSDEQKRRWKHGHAGLSGIHYFYLTQMKIKDAEGNLIRPIWRDVDETILDKFLECYANETDLYVFKRREIGLSSIFGGLIPLWISIMYPGSTSLMTSADLTRVSDLIANKFYAQWGSLDDWCRSKKVTYEKSKGIKLAELDEDGQETGNVADIVCRQTSQDKKDVTNLEGARAKYAFLDELFLHPYPEEVRSSVESCLMSGMGRTGIMVAGGSAGSISRVGIKEINKIIEGARSGMTAVLFLSGAMGITSATIRNEHGKKIGVEDFCINGWSDVARAEAYINWQREVYDAGSDKGKLKSFMKRYPLTLDEVLTPDDVGVIPKDVADRIPEQELELKNNPRNLRRIAISNNGMGSLSFVNDPKGFWLISEPPVKGMTYEMGTDCIPMLMKKDEMTMDPEGTERSMHCSVIKCIETNSYVAILLLRTSDEKLIYEQTMNGQLLYGGCLNMFERNRGDVLYLEYKNAGTLAMLAFQPVWIGAKGYKKNTTRGIYKDGQNTEKIYNAGFSYFREYMQNVDFPIILEQLRSFGLENADVIDAIFMCEVLSRGRAVSDGKRAIAVMKMKPKKVAYTTTDEFGRRVTRYKEVMSEKDREDYEAMMGGMQPITGF